MMIADPEGVIGAASEKWRWLQDAFHGLDHVWEMLIRFDGLDELKDLCEMRIDQPVEGLHVVWLSELVWSGK